MPVGAKTFLEEPVAKLSCPYYIYCSYGPDKLFIKVLENTFCFAESNYDFNNS